MDKDIPPQEPAAPEVLFTLTLPADVRFVRISQAARLTASAVYPKVAPDVQVTGILRSDPQQRFGRPIDAEDWETLARADPPVQPGDFPMSHERWRQTKKAIKAVCAAAGWRPLPRTDLWSTRRWFWTEARWGHHVYLEKLVRAGQVRVLDSLSYVELEADEVDLSARRSPNLLTVASFKKFAALLGIEVQGSAAPAVKQRDPDKFRRTEATYLAIIEAQRRLLVPGKTGQKNATLFRSNAALIQELNRLYYSTESGFSQSTLEKVYADAKGKLPPSDS